MHPKNPVKLGNVDFGKNLQKVDFFKRALDLSRIWAHSKLEQKVRVMTRLNPRMRPAIASQISLPKKVYPKWRKPLKSLAAALAVSTATFTLRISNPFSACDDGLMTFNLSDKYRQKWLLRWVSTKKLVFWYPK